MPQISEREFEVLPLRVHAFLADVALHDVWAVDLPRLRAGITLDEFRHRVTSARLFTPSPVVRAADARGPRALARTRGGCAKGPTGSSASSTGSRTNSWTN